MPRPARILLFDIEATDLEASFGHVLCFGYKYLGDRRTRVLSLLDYPTREKNREPDARLMQRVHEVLMDHADILVSFYGKEYDRKFLNSRMLMAGLPPLPPLSSEHVDLYFTARANLKLHSGRLQAVSESLGCPLTKTPVRADIWRWAARGDKKAMRYVTHHCGLDVDILEWVYLTLRAFVRRHPPVLPDKGACRVCGQCRWESRGWRYRYGQTDRRLRCLQCGAWTYSNVRGQQVHA